MTSRILIMEDEQPLLEEIAEWLNFEGYQTVNASNGREGVALALQYNPDLILSDIMMPDIDGYRAFLELRTHQATTLTPFIFMSAKADRRDVRYGMELGADDYITKPFTRAELLGAIRSRLTKQEIIQKYAETSVDQLRNTLTRMLPHELRTPLVSVLGNAEMLVMDAEQLNPDEIREMAEAIVRSSKRLHRLVENYLLYAQLELARTEPDRVFGLSTQKVDEPSLILASQSEKIAERFQRRSDLLLNLGNATIQVASNDFTKIITELLDNAFKFSKPGEPVRVSAYVRDDMYQVCVSSGGRGMSAEQIAEIGAFVQFERAIYEQQGSGLGLIIVKRLLELYQGSLEIESAAGRGTSVYANFIIMP